MAPKSIPGKLSLTHCCAELTGLSDFSMQWIAGKYLSASNPTEFF
jgi:hypothetical protein